MKARTDRVIARALAATEEVAEEVDKLARVMHDGLMGLPLDILDHIVHLVLQHGHVVGAALASTCTFFYSKMGGLEGPHQRRVEHIEAWDRQQRQAARARKRQWSHSRRTRQAAAIIELQSRKGQQGVGYRSMARKFGISIPSLRRLHSRFIENGFFLQQDWEMNVLESGLLFDDTDSSNDSNGG